MKNDIVDVFEACIDGTLDQVELDFEDNAAVCVVLASKGYPEHYEKGYPITGLEAFEDREGYYVFHAALGADLKQARKNAYAATEWVRFDNKYMRNDIGKAIDEV